jgi:hypothetical protein
MPGVGIWLLLGMKGSLWALIRINILSVMKKLNISGRTVNMEQVLAYSIMLTIGCNDEEGEIFSTGLGMRVAMLRYLSNRVNTIVLLPFVLRLVMPI